MESEDHVYIPEEIDNNAMLQTFESKRGDEEIPEHIIVNNDKENLVPSHFEETKATLVGPITATTTNTMHSKLSLLKKKIDSNNNTNRLKPQTTVVSSAYVSV